MSFARVGDEFDCDVLVVGSGAAGLSAAITARKAGLDVLLTEKADCFGGTTATSGGYLWIPNNRLAAEAGLLDSDEAARRYLRSELGEDYSAPHIDAFLEFGPRMVDFFVREMAIDLQVAPRIPDYHPDVPGASLGGRSLFAKPVDARVLGRDLNRLRCLPRELSLFGMGIGSGADLSDFYRFGRSLPSTLRVIRRLATYGLERVRHGRGLQLVNGSALVARLASRLLAMETPLWTSSPALELESTAGRISGAWIDRGGRRVHVRVRRGVILASGGFSHDVERRTSLYPHDAGAEEHLSLSAPGNRGDGARMVERVGGWVSAAGSHAAAWMPTSKVPRPGGGWGPIAHSVNLGKPGVIAVLRSGVRFADESLSYHDFVEQLLRLGGRHPESFIVCDAAAFGRYGLGFAKPFLPTRHLVKNRYLMVGRTLRALAEHAGIDVDAFTATVERYNEHARRGTDPEFGKGNSPYGHFLGDPTQALNANVAPLVRPPFYAIRMYPGDIGTFAGVETDAQARVLRRDGSVVEGLFAVGNDMASVFKGRYPGGGALIGPAMTFGYIAARHLAGP